MAERGRKAIQVKQTFGAKVWRCERAWSALSVGGQSRESRGGAKEAASRGRRGGQTPRMASYDIKEKVTVSEPCASDFSIR